MASGIMEDFSERKTIRLDREIYKQRYGFSITIATHEKYPWFFLYPVIAETAVQTLSVMARERKSSIFAWCIMPDHIHLLMQDRDVIEFVRLFKGKLTPVGRRLEKERKLWQRSFYDHSLRKEETLGIVAQYIWRNPVRKGIVDCATDYKFAGSFEWPEWKEMVFRD